MINWLAGLSVPEEWSTLFAFLLFNFYVFWMAVALGALYVSSRPVLGRVRTSPIWYFIASLWFMLTFISMVWAAPAEKSFAYIDAAGNADYFWNHLGTLTDLNARPSKVVIGLIFWAVGMVCLMIGAARGRAQKRALRDASILADDAVPAGVRATV